MAAEHLTREEQADLRESLWDKDSDDTLALVERIVARHRAEVAEQIAQAIEAVPVVLSMERPGHGGYQRIPTESATFRAKAAHVAREHKEGQ